MKKNKIISVFLVFLLSFPCHFLYNFFPNFIFASLFPVNESIWEHMKIIYTSLLITSVIEYIIIIKKNLNVSNYLFNYSITGILAIIIYLIMYLPLEIIFGHSFILAIILLFITYVISEIINCYLMNFNSIKNSLKYGFIIIIITYFIFTLFTYFPPKLTLFRDPTNNNYGILKEDN